MSPVLVYTIRDKLLTPNSGLVTISSLWQPGYELKYFEGRRVEMGRQTKEGTCACDRRGNLSFLTTKVTQDTKDRIRPPAHTHVYLQRQLHLERIRQPVSLPGQTERLPSFPVVR